MNTWKIILATLVIFGAGVITGGLLVSHTDHQVRKNQFARQRERAALPGVSNLPPPANLANREPGYPFNARPGNFPNSPNPQNPMGFQNPQIPAAVQNRLMRGMNLELLARLDEQVRLTPDQRERIEQIMREGQNRNKEIWERIAPDLRRENQDTQRRIREVLTPEQRQQFEELMKPRPGRRADDPVPPNQRPRDPRRPTPPREDAGSPAPNSPPPGPRENQNQ